MKTIMNKDKYEDLNEKQKMEIVKKAGEILKAGGLVAFPTETVYGLGADALNEKAAEKTYQAKGRPSDNPLIVHISDMEALYKIVEYVPEKAEIVAKHFWPGPLTMVFRKNDKVPYGTTGGLDTVAVRMPDHDLAQRIIGAGGGYISAPSANSSGRPSPTLAQHVAEDLNGKIDMIVDGGAVDIGVESTILDMTSAQPVILRPGMITKEMLSAVIGQVDIDKALIDEHSKEPPKAPGMKYRHYAPKAILTLVEGDIEKSIETINMLAQEKQEKGYKVGIIGTDESILEYRGEIVKSLGNRASVESVAHNLYKVLREFDQEEVDYIYSEAFFTDGIGYAIMNRLLKAAGNRVIRVEKKEETDDRNCM